MAQLEEQQRYQKPSNDTFHGHHFKLDLTINRFNEIQRKIQFFQQDFIENDRYR